MSSPIATLAQELSQQPKNIDLVTTPAKMQYEEQLYVRLRNILYLLFGQQLCSGYFNCCA